MEVSTPLVGKFLCFFKFKIKINQDFFLLCIFKPFDLVYGLNGGFARQYDTHVELPPRGELTLPIV